MNGALEILNSRFETATRRKAAAEEAIRAAQAELAEAIRQCEIWSAAIKLESRELGVPPKKQSVKTSHLVLDAIRARPDGITALGLFGNLNGAWNGKKTYIYSILKRLRDRGMVEVLDDKYFITEKGRNNKSSEEGED
jgi:hypothetical protein